MATAVLDRAVTIATPLAARIEAWLARPVAWASAIAAVIALQLVLTAGHLPWLDEYQALQIAVQSPDMAHLLENLRYEGHPPLWYLLLRGAAVIVPPWWALAAVAVPLALAIQAIVLLRAPFARLDRLLIATGTFVLFEYGAVSRSLTLGVTLLLVAFAFRERRWSWIALALLPMADFIFGALSLVLLAIAWRERRLWTPGVALWAMMSLAAAWTVRPAHDVVPAFARSGIVADAGSWLNRLSIMLLPLQTNEGRLEWNAADRPRQHRGPAVPAVRHTDAARRAVSPCPLERLRRVHAGVQRRGLSTRDPAPVAGRAVAAAARLARERARFGGAARLPMVAGSGLG